MLKLLENSLGYYDKVLFLDIEELIPVLECFKAFPMSNQKILVLSTNPCQLDSHVFPRAACGSVSDCKACIKECTERQRITCRQISKEEARQLAELYGTYEFSDKFLCLSSDSTSYGNLYHMVDTGMLTLEEFAATLLG